MRANVGDATGRGGRSVAAVSSALLWVFVRRGPQTPTVATRAARRRADDGAMDGARRTRDDARAFASCATTTRVLDDGATREDDAWRDDGRTTTTRTTRRATTRVRCDARGANADEGDDAKGAVTTARYAPAWAVGGGKGRARDAGRARDDGDDDDDAREGARGKKSAGKRSDAAFAVTVTRALERGTRGWCGCGATRRRAGGVRARRGGTRRATRSGEWGGTTAILPSFARFTRR